MFAKGWRFFLLPCLLALVVTNSSCSRRFPGGDLSALDQKLLGICRDGPGAVAVLDERYDDYWGNGYDTTSYLMLGEEEGGSTTGAPTRRMAVHHLVLKIVSPRGTKNASTFTVEHYREKVPPVEVHLWAADGHEKKVNVQATRTVPLVDWPCENGFPRQTTFRIGPLAVGDIVEIIKPVSGPNQLIWHFGSSRFCVQSSRVVFGHPDDEYRADMQALVVDASGGVKLTSLPGEYPLTFELTRPLPPLSPERIPFVLLSPHCPGWSNLRGRIFKTALWMARAGKVTGRKQVNPFLASSVKDNQKARRIATLAGWMNRSIHLDPAPATYWYRWMPVEPAFKTASKRHGPPGNWAVLAFRVLEDAGLKPRLALIHSNPKNPFQHDIPTVAQMDTLAVVVDDETGKTHWLVPGIEYQPEDQPPGSLRGKKALLLERWWLDREQGAGRCQPELETTFSCQISTPEPVELQLVSIGYEEQQQQVERGATLH